MRKHNMALETLTAMNQRQQEQFTQATVLAIGVVMKKVGIDEISVGPEDFAKLLPGEKVTVEELVDGGFTYRLTQRPQLASQEG